MNQSKLLAFTIATVLTCVSFASCGDDDKNDEPKPTQPDTPTLPENPNTPAAPVPSVAKRLVSVSRPDGLNASLMYDSNGILRGVAYRRDGEEIEREEFVYSSSKITVANTYLTTGYSYTNTYILTDGIITRRQYESPYSGTISETSYLYDNRRISKWNGTGGSYANFSWAEGDISKNYIHTVSDIAGTYTLNASYTYDNCYDYGGIAVFVQGLLDSLNPYLAMQGFFGDRPLHLPKEAYMESESGGIYLYSWSYEFDVDGYPVSMTEIEKYNNDEFIYSYVFTWETL